MILRRSLVFLLGLFVFFFIANSVALGAHSPSFHVIPDKNVAGFVHTVSGKKIVFQYFSWKRASANRLQLWKKLNKPLYLILPGFKLVVCKIKRKLGRPVWEAEIISGSGKLIKPRENLFFSIGDSQKNRALYLQLKRKSRATIVGVQHAVALFKKSKQLREKKQFRSAIKMLFSIYKATRLSAEYRARALFQIADIFFEDWSPNSLGNSLADHCGAREIWFELIRQFSFKNRWVERAFYELAKYYESPFEKHDNKVMYSYLKRAGRFGRVYFSYARNLLSGLPGNSILMTEGGDNQVFGMQMLTRLEKVRPDVSVYDQKGNIFTKIYGDFHYIRSSFVSLRKTIVDHTLFSGGNPVFLTWERSPSVATCGDFSLARQGMLWRVVPLRYKLLRILPRFSMQNNISISKVQYVAQLLYKNKRRMKALKENFGKVKKFFSFYKKGKLHFINAGSRARIMNAAASYKRFARNALTRKIDSRFVKKILLKLTQEKLIQVQGDTIKILRWSPLKDSLAIWKQYKFLHAVYKDVAGWPYLLREIVVNDYFYLMQICQDQLRQVEYSKRYGMISADRANAMRIRIKHILGGSQKKLLRFSHDMWTVRYNIAILLLRKKLYKKALALLEPFAKPTYFGKSALSLYLWLKLQVATLSSDPAQELAALVLIRKKLKQVRASLYKQFPGGKGERIYRQYFRYVIRISRMRSQNSLSQQKRLMKLALRSGAEEDCMRFFLHCSNRFDFLKIIAFFEKRADLKWKNEKLALQYIIAAALVGPPPKAYQVLEKGMRLFPNNRIMRLYKESIEQKLVQ